jgi:hypothetical protein
LLGEVLTLRQLSERKISARAEESTGAPPGRRKIWDFATHFHCPIIGTCLSTGELRHILIKLGRQESATALEHDLHASGVLIASHAAMSLVKRACRQSGKPFLALRGAGLAPFCAALNKRTAFIPSSLPQAGA